MDDKVLEGWAKGLVEHAEGIDFAMLAASSIPPSQLSKIAQLTGYAMSAKNFLKNK